MTTDDKALVRDWVDVLASGPAEAFRSRVAEDVVIRLPFAPPGVAAEMRGMHQAIEVMAAHWDSIERFDWLDVMIRRTEDPELFLTTARSEVVYRSAVHYSNDYVLLTRLRGGKVAEHVEYFNPLPVLHMLDPA